MTYERPHNWYVAILAKDETKDTITGTDRQFICRDLKTLRGVVNRYKKVLEKFKGNFRMEVYNFYDTYNPNTYHLKAVIE